MTRFVVLLLLVLWATVSFTWAAPVAPTTDTGASAVTGDVVTGDEKTNTTTIPPTTGTAPRPENTTGDITKNATNFQVYGLSGQTAGFVVHAKNLSFFTNSTGDSATNNTNTIIGLVVGFGVFGFIILLLSSAK